MASHQCFVITQLLYKSAWLLLYASKATSVSGHPYLIVNVICPWKVVLHLDKNDTFKATCDKVHE